MYEAGKGDKQRPTDHEAYASNYDAIFSKKPIEQPKEEEDVLQRPGNECEVQA